MYGESNAKTIINNCDRYIYMGGMDLETSKNIAERIGAPVTVVLYMPVGSEIVFQRGLKPVRTTRYAITKDPLYQKLTAEYNC
jgi:type IV secretory pathway TraG/TraD family ATPase VirD4